MSDWKFAERDPSERLARLHYFSVKKGPPGEEVEYVITVKEFASAEIRPMLFFAQADRQARLPGVNYLPSGWGETLLAALSECLRAIERFPGGQEGTRPESVSTPPL